MAGMLKSQTNIYIFLTKMNMLRVFIRNTQPVITDNASREMEILQKIPKEQRI